MYCHKCGNELNGDSHFCRYCGAATEQLNDTQEEQEFLDTTHRLLRWERKAWNILGTYLFIGGIVIVALCSILGFMDLVLAVEGDNTGAGTIALSAIYGLIGILYIGWGALHKIAAGKINQYLDNLYNDFKPTEDRCGSIGMIVFAYFFNSIALVFFIINFVRMKTNKSIIQRILSRQASSLSCNNETR